jgi:tetratricopeptide (TPR) repeat protein
MTFRGLRTGLLGAAALLAFASYSAQAAVTVLGNKIGQSCYMTAEFGGNAEDGIKTCTVALDETAMPLTDRAATFINRGILRTRVEDSAGALDDYNRGLALDANLGEGYVDRGAVEIVNGKYDVAVQDITKGLDLGTNKPEIAHYDRGLAYEALGNVRGAYDDYKKAVEIDPTFNLASDQLTRFKVVVHKRPDGT